MESRSMEIKLISALGLYCPNFFSKPEPYASAWISNDPINKHYSPVDRSHGINPIWNQDMKFIVDEAALQQGSLLFETKISTETTFGEKEMGHASIPLNEFLKLKSATTSPQFVCHKVLKPSGKAKGCVFLSVKLEDKGEVKPQAVAGSYSAGKAETVTPYPAGSGGASNAEPVTGYTAYPPAGSSSQPPPYPPQNNQYTPPTYPPQAGYAPLPPHYQSCPQPPYHYSHYQGLYPPRNNNIPGMGLGKVGATLLGDAAGLLIEDVILDGYDVGFDGGNF